MENHAGNQLRPPRGRQVKGHVPVNDFVYGEAVRYRQRAARRKLVLVEGAGTNLAAGEVVEPAAEAGTIFRPHGDKSDSHALVGSGAAHDGASANLAFGSIEEHLDITAWRERFCNADEHAAQGKIIDARDKPTARGGPGEERALRRSHARVAAKIVLLRHSEVPGGKSYSLLSELERRD